MILSIPTKDNDSKRSSPMTALFNEKKQREGRKSLHHFSRKISFLLFLLVLPVLLISFPENSRSAGPTYVSGNITSDTTWKIEDSPYIVTDTVTIRDEATLTIA